MNFDIQNDLKALLNEIFGFTEFRPGQLEIIEFMGSFCTNMAQKEE